MDTKKKYTEDWFFNQEMQSRHIASDIWLLFLSPAILTATIVLINFSLWSPLSWVTESVSSLLSFRTILKLFALQLCCVMFTFAHSRTIAVHKHKQGTFKRTLLFYIHHKQLSTVALLLVSAILCFTVLQTTTFAGSNVFHTSFTTMLAPFLAACYILDFYRKALYNISFPVVQQKKFFRFKRQIPETAKESVTFTVQVLKNYYPAYILSSILYHTILYHNVNESENQGLFTILYNATDLCLFWKSFTLTTATVFVMKISNHLLHIFATQRYSFCMEHTSDTEVTLVDGLTSHSSLLKHHAFLEFSLLSATDNSRRGTFFQLSFPGNQAHVWNKTVSECTKMLTQQNTLMCSIQQQNKEIPQARNVGAQQLFSPQHNNDDSNNKNLSPKKVTDEKDSISESAELPQTKDIFENLDLMLWCIQGVCSLVAVSYTQDQYGVVQRNLSDVLTRLLTLLQTCEQLSRKLNIQSFTAKKHEDVRQLSTLKTALNTGLYTITSEFGNHIGTVNIADESLKKKLFQFIESTQ